MFIFLYAAVCAQATDIYLFWGRRRAVCRVREPQVDIFMSGGDAQHHWHNANAWLTFDDYFNGIADRTSM